MYKISCICVIGVGVLLSNASQALAVNDCRLSGAWVSETNGGVYSFDAIHDGKNSGKFSYELPSWPASYIGEYSLEDQGKKLHLSFVDDQQRHRDVYFKISMSPPEQPSMFWLAGDPNPAMPQPQEKFHVKSEADRTLNLSLCNR